MGVDEGKFRDKRMWRLIDTRRSLNR
jgi:hypothetical protein